MKRKPRQRFKVFALLVSLIAVLAVGTGIEVEASANYPNARPPVPAFTETPYAVTGLSPAKGETGVDWNLSEVTITFDQDITGLGSNIADLIVVEEESTKELIQEPYDPSLYGLASGTLAQGGVLRIPLTRPLKPGDIYNVMISEGALLGEPGTNPGSVAEYNRVIAWSFMAKETPKFVNNGWSFEPGAILIPQEPIPSGIHAGLNTYGAAIDKSIAIEFDTPIRLKTGYNPNSINVTGISPYHAMNTHVYTEGNRLIIVPTESTSGIEGHLKPGTVYRVTVPKAVIFAKDDSTAEDDQYGNEQITFTFETAHSFMDAFVISEAFTINNEIFRTAPPRQVGVMIPRKYIREVEIIYHPTMSTDAQYSGQSLTNFDIKADPEVYSVTLETRRAVRTNLRRNSQGIFTAGVAGLDASIEHLSDVKIYAYDEFGKLIDTDNFKLTADGKGGIQKRVYDKSSATGKTYTLYELMANIKLFNDILETRTAHELYVLYPY